MDSNNTAERVVVETQTSPQPIVLNHQIGQTSIRLTRPAQPIQQAVRAATAAVRQPVLQVIMSRKHTFWHFRNTEINNWLYNENDYGVLSMYNSIILNITVLKNFCFLISNMF